MKTSFSSKKNAVDAFASTAVMITERGGFEPPKAFDLTRLPIVHLRPLGHLSKGVLRQVCTEREGFEPSMQTSHITDFESVSFDLSDISPRRKDDTIPVPTWIIYYFQKDYSRVLDTNIPVLFIVACCKWQKHPVCDLL